MKKNFTAAVAAIAIAFTMIIGTVIPVQAASYNRSSSGTTTTSDVVDTIKVKVNADTFDVEAPSSVKPSTNPVKLISDAVTTGADGVTRYSFVYQYTPQGGTTRNTTLFLNDNKTDISFVISQGTVLGEGKLVAGDILTLTFKSDGTVTSNITKANNTNPANTGNNNGNTGNNNGNGTEVKKSSKKKATKRKAGKSGKKVKKTKKTKKTKNSSSTTETSQSSSYNWSIEEITSDDDGGNSTTTTSTSSVNNTSSTSSTGSDWDSWIKGIEKFDF